MSSNQGKIVQIIGAVVDVEFPRESVPKVYDALKVQNTAITLEVQQQLGDGVVRTIALGSTRIETQPDCDNTVRAISVPSARHPGPIRTSSFADRRGRPVDVRPLGNPSRRSHYDTRLQQRTVETWIKGHLLMFPSPRRQGRLCGGCGVGRRNRWN